MKMIAPFFLSLRRPVFILLLLAAPLTGRAGEVQAWVLLLLNPAAPATIISTDVQEKDNLVKAGWKLSGTGLLLAEGGPDLGELHRMLKSTTGGTDRAIAVGADQVATREKEGYTTEGVLGHAAMKEQPGALPVVRYAKDGLYLWMMDPGDQSWAAQFGWQKDAVAFWLLPTS